MKPQIFGTKKCKDTQKAIRFFKERGVDFQFVDLTQKAISPGELESISRKTGLEALIDIGGRQYEKRNLKYIKHDVREVLLEDPLLFRTPIVRHDKGVTVGYQPDTWKTWLAG